MCAVSGQLQAQTDSIREEEEALAEPEVPSLLIRNVMILKPKESQEDVLVNLILRGGKLEIVTLDKVATDAVDMALDAQGGFLLGKLKPGTSPSFIVLSADPRADFGVLLDTNRYTTLAIESGKIVRNLLLRPAPEPTQAGGQVEDDEPPKRSGWLAYTPPPIALPLYFDPAEKWNGWDTKWSRGAFIAAVVLDRMNWQGQNSASETQLGEDLDTYDGGEIRALRFGVVGSIEFERPWIYTVFAATNAFDKGFDTNDDDDLTIFDLRVDIPTVGGTTLSVGKQKEPISMERLSGGPYLPMQERSIGVDAMLPARNTGVVLSGNALETDMTWAVGIFNNWLDSQGEISDNATQVVGRITGLPAYSEDESNLLHLGIGFRHSDTKKGLAYSSEPEFNQAPDFIDTGPFDANNSLTYDVEAAWLRGPFWLFGEYLWSDTDAPLSGNPSFHGHSLTAAWNLTGEMRSYNRRSGLFNPVPVAKDVDNGGSGTLEGTVRWSSLDTNDAGIEGGDLDIYSVGFNWWLTSSFVASVNYRWIRLDRDGFDGESHGLMTRIVMILD